LILKTIRKSLTLKWMVLLALLAVISLIIACLSIFQIYHEDLKRSFIAVEGIVLILGILFIFFLTKKVILPIKWMSKRVEEELVKRTRELEVLNEIGALINQNLGNLDKVFSITVEKVANLTGYEMGALFLLNEVGDILEMKSQIGHSPAMLKEVKVLKFSEGVSGEAIGLKQPVIVSISEYPSARIAPILREEGVQTVVGIPLMAKGKAIGAIILSSRSPRKLSPREVNSLESIGNQIGIALENTKLFSTVAKAKSEWETTFDAVTDLITIRDKDYRIIRANASAFKRFGLRPEEMIGKRCFETLHQSNKPCEGCYVTEVLKTKKPASGERDSKYLNGIFQYFIFPVYDEAGEVVAVVDLAREITEEKRLEIEREVVDNVNKILASSLDMKQVIRAVHAELKRVLDCERMTVTLFDEEEKGFRYFALEKDYEAKEFVEGVIYPQKGSHFETVAETGLPEIVTNTAETDSWIGQKLLKEGIHSTLIFPLEYKRKIIGTVNLGSRKTNHFSKAQFNMLQQIASGLAIFIQNTLLFQEIKKSEEKYRTVVESAIDGVCVVGGDYQFKYGNERLTEILGYSQEELIGKDLRDFLDEENKALFTDRENKRKQGIKSSPRFELNMLRKDGKFRNMEVSARAIKNFAGNVNIIAFLRDVTEHKQWEKALRESEGTARRLSQENATVAEIGRIISSTLNIEEVYERFAEKVRKILPFDRVSVNTMDPGLTSIAIAYTFGVKIGDSEEGIHITMESSVYEDIVNRRSSILIQTENESELAGRYPNFVRHFRAGLRSMIATPLISQDQLIGILHIQSLKPHAYTESDVRLAERVGNQIAGAIANSQLFIERKRAEEALQRSEEEARRLAQENATVAEIGRIISSTLDIEEVYEGFAEKAHKLIPFDRIMINLTDPKNNTINTAYITGVDVPDQRPGNITPLTGTATEEVVRIRSSLLIQRDNIDEVASRFPRLLPTFQAGFRSLIFVPMISKDQVIGVLSFRSLVPKAYTDQDVRLAESISNQIAGAIANAQLFTERKQAEEALRTEKQRFQTVSENAPFGMAMIDQTGTYKYINPKFKELFGYDLNDIPDGKTWYRKAFPDPAYRHHAISVWINDNRLGSHEPGEKTIRTFTVTCKDGTEKIIEFLPVKLETGEYLTSFVDITLRKRAEDALQRSEEAATRLAQENAIVAEIGRIISSTLNIEEVYERFAEEVRKFIQFERITINNINPKENTFVVLYNFGPYLADREIGKPVPLAGTATEWVMQNRSSLVILEENREEMLGRIPGFLTIFKAGFRSMMLIPLISKDQVIGTLALQSFKQNAYTEVDLRLAERVSAQIAGAIANAQLYFERSRIEEALRRSEERYRNILESIEEGYYEVDLAGNFNFLNDSMYRIWGYSEEELMGMNNRQYSEKENAKKLFQAFNKVYRTGEPCRVFDYEITKKDGTKATIELSASLIRDSEGKPIGFRGISRDVTEHKRIEEQLLQTEKLRAVGEMASGVAHDFNNALAAILGNTQLLLYTTHDEELKETLKIIEKVAKDSSQTIRRLQDFTRKRVDQELFKVNINAIIKDSMEMTKPKWKDEPESRGIRIEMVSNLKEIPSVSGNASELREVITNMIFNAIEAMPEGGKIEICTFKKRRSVFIQISDSGIGIAEEAERKIFEPFFTTKPFTNTGLGLSMSYGIIKRFGGEIEVESKVGQGTTFTIILPIGGEEKEEAVSPQPTKKGREAHILVIDDDEFVRNVLSRTFAQANHQVTLAESGEKGIELFKKGKFDIVLTDLGMPGMSGWEVCRGIKEISPHTPIGMITGWGVEKNRNEVEECGLDFFISKPFDFNQILNVISETMAFKEE
jgi:two-component system cell cycle sensor histidine kinase/response regulator CckA